MKVKIGNYTSFFGPYQLAETLCFWVKSQKDELGIYNKPRWVHKFGEWLAYGYVEPDLETDDLLDLRRERPITWLYRFLLWIDKFKTRKVSIKIDRFDTWNMDNTLALLIVPMLKQLRKNKHGSPYVDDNDVPEELRSSSAPPLSEEEKNQGHVDKYHHDRWNHVLDHMIWSFEQVLRDDRESQFYSGKHDLKFKKLDDGNYELVKGDHDTFKVDYTSQKEYEGKIQQGINLFAKYYFNLWD